MKKGRTPNRAYGPFLCLLLAACHQGTAPTAEQNRQLDNAEAMLDSAPRTLSNIDENALAPADGNSLNEASAASRAR